MRLRKTRAAFEGPDFDALIKRTKSLGTEEILEALDLTVSTLGRYVSEYRKGRDVYILDEMRMWAETLYVTAEELKSRKESVSDIAPARQRGRHY